MTTGFSTWASAAQAADTGNTAPQTGKIVSDEPGKNAPNILDGTVYSIAKVGNTIVVGGQFTQAQNYNTSTTLTRRNLLAFDATTGKISHDLRPRPARHRLQGAAGRRRPVGLRRRFVHRPPPASRCRVALFKINVATGVVDPTFIAPTISGDIRDLELVGNHLFVAGKFTHINGIAAEGPRHASTPTPASATPTSTPSSPASTAPRSPARSPTCCRSRSTSRTPS